SMMLPLMQQGMLLCGVPYSEQALHLTQSGGTPYGPSHLAGGNSNLALTEDEITICKAFGKRIAKIPVKLDEYSYTAFAAQNNLGAKSFLPVLYIADSLGQLLESDEN